MESVNIEVITQQTIGKTNLRNALTDLVIVMRDVPDIEMTDTVMTAMNVIIEMIGTRMVTGPVTQTGNMIDVPTSIRKGESWQQMKNKPEVDPQAVLDLDLCQDQGPGATADQSLVARALMNYSQTPSVLDTITRHTPMVNAA